MNETAESILNTLCLIKTRELARFVLISNANPLQGASLRQRSLDKRNETVLLEYRYKGCL